MKNCYFLFGLFLISALVYAQQSNFYLTTEDLGDISQVRVECKDGEKIILENAKIENNTITGLSVKGQDTNIKTFNIRELQTKRGHYGATVGYVGMFIIGIPIQLATMRETTYTVETNWPATILGYMSGYAIGYFIGKTIPKWRTVYNTDEFGFNHEKLPFNILYRKI